MTSASPVELEDEWRVCWRFGRGCEDEEASELVLWVRSIGPGEETAAPLSTVLADMVDE